MFLNVKERLLLYVLALIYLITATDSAEDSGHNGQKRGSNSQGYNGLFIMTTGSKSNMNFFESIIEALVENGHTLTFVTPYSGVKNPYSGGKNQHLSSKVRRIKIEDNRDDVIGNKFETNIFQLFSKSLNYIPQQCLKVLRNDAVRKILEDKYDYVIVAIFGADCFLGYAYDRKIPIIMASQNALFGWHSKNFGIVEYPEIGALGMLDFPFPPTFLQRIKATLFNTGLMLLFTFNTDNSMETICRKEGLWHESTPSLEELFRSVNLAIVNSVQAWEQPPKVLPPNVIYAGGIHIKKNLDTNEMDADLRDWLDESGDEGFILFSLGTAVRTADMKDSHLKTILKVFGSLRQRIIWKWDSTDLKNIPQNVKIRQWLPQQSILNHPKIKLFITHGGLFSCIEAAYFKVPVVGVPIYADQQGNVNKFVRQGWGRRISWNDFNEKEFKNAIIDTINNKSARAAVEKYSHLMKDWPRDPKKEVQYWVDYVIRHNGAPHLKSYFSEMPWYELTNLDVYSVIFLCLILIAASIICVLILLYRCTQKLCRKPKLD